MSIFWKEEREIKKIFIIDYLLCSVSFLLVPIIPIYMNSVLNFQVAQIGFIVGIPSVICCFLGGISYYFYRKIGMFYSVLFSMLLDIFVFIIMLFKPCFSIVIIFYILKGISNSIFMPILKNLYIIVLKNKENTNIVFKYRYILICMSAIISPYISTIIYPKSTNLIFYIALVLYFISIIIFLSYREYIKKLDIKQNKKVNVIEILKERKIFSIFLMACVGILTVFSQFEGTFVLTLEKNSLNIFTKLLILNSIFGIIFQILNLNFLKKLTAYQNLILGCCFFGITYFSFLLTYKNLYLSIFSILLFTLGETFIMPNIETFIAEISMDEDRVLLYGISEFKSLGFFLGPFISGYLIQKLSVSIMFCFFSVISLISCILFITFYKIQKSKY